MAFFVLMEILFVSCSLTFTRLTRHIKMRCNNLYATTRAEAFLYGLFLPLFTTFITCFFTLYTHWIAAHNLASLGIQMTFSFNGRLQLAKLLKYHFKHDWLLILSWQNQIIYEYVYCNQNHFWNRLQFTFLNVLPNRIEQTKNWMLSVYVCVMFLLHLKFGWTMLFITKIDTVYPSNEIDMWRGNFEWRKYTCDHLNLLEFAFFFFAVPILALHFIHVKRGCDDRGKYALVSTRRWTLHKIRSFIDMTR